MLKKFKLNALVVAVAATTICSMNVSAAKYKDMGQFKDVVVPTSFLLLEAGASYSHAFYQNSVTTAESFTVLTPNGRSMNPGNFYPSNFWGGYIGVSLLRDMMLYNIRYDMFAMSSKNYAGVTSRFAPTKLSFTFDKLWGDLNAFSYGLGAGVVVATTNAGDVRTTSSDTLPNGQYVTPVLGESIIGRARIEPLVEAVGMYHVADNVNIRLNVAYQIPVNNTLTNGSINANLGINYALPL